MEGSSEFTEISHCVAGPGANLELGVDSLYDGCTCSGQCEYGLQSRCSCNCAYDKNGHISNVYLQECSMPVMECNSRCTCNHQCRNRTSQNEVCQQLTLTETESKGLGVKTSVDLPQGVYIGEYVGEVISNLLTDLRLKSTESADNCYIIQYREHLSNSVTMTTNIDATYKGNITRFINHSCDPNLIIVPIRSDSIIPRLCLFTCKNVNAGEELCFSYFGKRTTFARDKVLGSKPCACNSHNCVGYLPFDTT